MDLKFWWHFKQLTGNTKCLKLGSIPGKFLIHWIYFHVCLSFSTTRTLKTYLRNTMNTNRLSWLTLLNIYRVKQLSADTVFDILCIRKERTWTLIFFRINFEADSTMCTKKKNHNDIYLRVSWTVFVGSPKVVIFNLYPTHKIKRWISPRLRQMMHGRLFSCFSMMKIQEKLNERKFFILPRPTPLN